MDIIEHLHQQEVWPLHLFGIDFAITNGVITMWLAVLLTILFFSLANRKLSLVPGKLQNLAEVVVVFVRSEMASQIHHGSEKWLPFLMAIFSFILVNNLLALIPNVASATGNINTTATLAIIVFLVVQVTGIRKHGLIKYLKMLVPSGLPVAIAVIMVPLELVSQLARPFSLALRLFANMFAGHAIMLIVISLIFIFKSYLILPIPVISNTVFLMFEIVIGFIQAFVFTYLSSLYIGMALEEGH